MDVQPHGTERKRSRFRPLHSFSLRTFLVLVTLFGVWLGMQWKWIRDRHSYFAEHTGAFGPPEPGDPEVSAPGLLRIFGERGTFRLVVFADDWHARRERGAKDCPQASEARRLFPESQIVIEDHQQAVWNTWFPGKPLLWKPPGSTSTPPQVPNNAFE